MQPALQPGLRERSSPACALVSDPLRVAWRSNPSAQIAATPNHAVEPLCL